MKIKKFRILFAVVCGLLGSTGNAQEQELCKVVKLAEIAKITNLKLTSATNEPGPFTDNCAYRKANVALSAWLWIKYNTSTDPVAAAQAITRQEGGEVIGGVGQKAFYYSYGGRTGQIVFVSNRGVAFSIDLQAYDDYAGDTKKALIEIARLTLAATKL